MMAYTTTKQIRFGHCDPARLIFYPRAFELLNEVVEDWFESLGYPFFKMHGEMQIGAPAVDLRAEFKRPLRHGDVADFTVHEVQVGRASLNFQVTARVNDIVHVIFHPVIVCLDMTKDAARPWPDELRFRFLQHDQTKADLAS